jgi:hypothetical protein
LDLAQIVPRAVILIKRNAQTPDVTLANTRHGFFAQRLGAAVKAARAIAEGKIRRVRLSKSQNIFRRFAINFRISGLDMSFSARISLPS